MIIQNSIVGGNASVIVSNGKLIVCEEEVPMPPNSHNGTRSVSICNNRVYINGYEWKSDKHCWKRTFKALWNLWF